MEVVWALIVVLGGGSVNFSTGYPNEAVCKDAISIARTGLTVAEKESEDAKDQIARAKAKQEWEASHPGKNYEHDSFMGQMLFQSSVTIYPEREIKYARCVLVPKN